MSRRSVSSGLVNPGCGATPGSAMQSLPLEVLTNRDAAGRRPLLPLGTNSMRADAQGSIGSWRIALLSVSALTVAILAGCGGSGDRSAAIADEIGAQSCTATNYQIIRRLDNTKARIYDCTVDSDPVDANGVQTFGDSKTICVTEENGIASDQTATVKLLFANALSGGKPDCAS